MTGAVAGRARMGDALSVQSAADPTRAMAEKMAQLLAGSDLHELREIVDRWVTEAPTERVKEQYRNFGKKLLELKAALADAPVQPTTEELELALAMMLKLAADAGPGAFGPPR